MSRTDCITRGAADRARDSEHQTQTTQGHRPHRDRRRRRLDNEDVYSHTLAEDTTRPTKRTRLDWHTLPALGHYPGGAIKPPTKAAAVATWSKTLAPGTVGQTLRQVRQILDAALADRLISSNPAQTMKPQSAAASGCAPVRR
ncbi:MAG: hypothetical protein ACR2LX_03250 [Jatrophihabitans sp.]